MKFKAIVFDFGNVLCSVDRESFVQKALGHSPLEREALISALWEGDLEIEYETGKIDSRTYFERAAAAARFDPEYTYEQFVQDYTAIVQPHPDGEQGLIAAHEEGYRTFVLSNTAFLHARLIFDNEVFASIPELHILSYKIGVMKPDPRIWLKLLEYAGLEAAECLYIDDLQSNCDAAGALGFGTFTYDKKMHNLARIVKNSSKMR
jgi:HAD superfamily hydrolase (TIGR01509 family)